MDELKLSAVETVRISPTEFLLLYVEETIPAGRRKFRLIIKSEPAGETLFDLTLNGVHGSAPIIAFDAIFERPKHQVLADFRTQIRLALEKIKDQLKTLERPQIGD